MAEKHTIARPYGEAVFELAREANALDAWSEALGLAGELLR
jgi:F-type H+-transporting ATPase subunit delta